MKHFIFILPFLVLSFNGWTTTPLLSFPLLSKSSLADDPKHIKQEQLRVAQMKVFVSLSGSDYEKLKGRRINFIEKTFFKFSQKRMTKMLRQYAYGDVTMLQKISWLLKGLVLGPIAVLLAYLFATEDDRELIKWAWFGFAGQIILIGVILLFFV